MSGEDILLVKKMINDAFSNIDLSDLDIDMSNYATKDDISNMIEINQPSQSENGGD